MQVRHSQYPRPLVRGRNCALINPFCCHKLGWDTRLSAGVITCNTEGVGGGGTFSI